MKKHPDFIIVIPLHKEFLMTGAIKNVETNCYKYSKIVSMPNEHQQNFIKFLTRQGHTEPQTVLTVLLNHVKVSINAYPHKDGANDWLEEAQKRCKEIVEDLKRSDVKIELYQ